MHTDPKLKVLFPKIAVVTRQNFNIKKRIMRNRFDKKMAGDRDGICSEAGNFKLHDKRCMDCERMVDGKTELLTTNTKREYKIKQHYTCQSTWCISVLTCKIFMAQYTGQTTQTMQKRHYGH